MGMPKSNKINDIALTETSEDKLQATIQKFKLTHFKALSTHLPCITLLMLGKSEKI